jgi:hypothetical protein
MIGLPLIALIVACVLSTRLRGAEPLKAATLLCWLGLNAYVIIFTISIYLFAISEGTLAMGGVQPYYFELALAGTILNLIFLASEFTVWISRVRLLPSVVRTGIQWAPAIVAALILLLGGVRLQRFTTYHPSNDVVNATTAEWLRESLSPSDRILAIDHAGVIGYVSELSVVNGDGLINSWEYWETLRAGSLESWLQRNEVAYLYVGTGEGDPVGSLEMREGRPVVVIKLHLRGTRKYELIAEVGQEVYRAPFQWVFPVSAIRFKVD